MKFSTLLNFVFHLRFSAIASVDHSDFFTEKAHLSSASKLPEVFEVSPA